MLLVGVGLLVLALATRYTVASCPSGMGPRGVVHTGCYVLDRWTGEVAFQRPGE